MRKESMKVKLQVIQGGKVAVGTNARAKRDVDVNASRHYRINGEPVQQGVTIF